ncbi:hypothetical protein [Pseudactinotalea terrae]|uniref:hypothetical protein n=1 Tax=Pseudactinotalea terrae TaxID=1743262 RepID=UPI0012E11586|nr:hypothetical protein [Pseudactinotalea terrae]
MSRTHAHVPAHVEQQRADPGTLVPHRYGHWVPRVGSISCDQVGCPGVVARWASSQPWTRRGSAVIERRAAVRDRLRAAAREYRTTGPVLADVMPDPLIFCLCEGCGVD